MRIISFLVFLCLAICLSAQSPTPAEQRITSMDHRSSLHEESLVNRIPFENIGPTVFSGRVVDIAVNPSDPTIFYVAYASGGLWKTTNNGTTFEPIFDSEAVMTIGDIAVDWVSNIIWVGTGENNSSRSSYAGIGMYRSTDDGGHWEYKGLPESHHIGRIVLHPTDTNILWCAVLGHLYSESEERGIYKTINNGASWRRVLYVDSITGGIDLILNPSDPDQLFAALWQRERTAWNFEEAGSGSGLYTSTNGGEEWQQINRGTNGFPADQGVGRIGLDIYQDEDSTLLYAILDNYNRRSEEEEEDSDEILTKDDLREMDTQTFLKLDEKKIKGFLTTNNFPKKYTATVVKERIEKGELSPIALVEYLENANSLLFDTPVIGAEIYSSADFGKTWTKTHQEHINGLYNSYGYYFGQIRVNPVNADQLFVLGVPILRSDDRGHSWKNVNGGNVHVDHHALWINKDRPGHIILGNDGGIHISYDQGENWIKCNSPSVGQFYHVNIDLETPYNVYGGLQDNGVWYGAHTNEPNTNWHGHGQYPFKRLMGGDGMQTAIDHRDNNTIYTGFQFGNYYRINKNTGKRKYITPKHELGDRPYRWNWQSPILLSPHNQDIVYLGGNKLFRSFNRGNDFHPISEDLTKGGRKGDVAFGTLTTIDESSLQFGILYTGSDDGLVQVSRDGGVSWSDISPVESELWVSRVQASSHVKGRVYVALNGYRNDDFSAYLYRSDDYGKNWSSIADGLPAEPVNVVKEDPVNDQIIYVGTDHHVYVSIDGGMTYMALSEDIPSTPIHDLVIHPRENDLVIGTHGRSIYVGNISPLQQLTDENLSKDLILYDVEAVSYNKSWGKKNNIYTDPKTPKVHLALYSNEDREIQLEVKLDDLVLYLQAVSVEKGLNYIPYELIVDSAQLESYRTALESSDETTKVKPSDNKNIYLRPGEYTIRAFTSDAEATTPFTVE